MKDQAYWSGYNACWNGEPRESNPYPENTDDYYNWNNGWDYANRRKNQ